MKTLEGTPWDYHRQLFNQMAEFDWPVAYQKRPLTQADCMVFIEWLDERGHTEVADRVRDYMVKAELEPGFEFETAKPDSDSEVSIEESDHKPFPWSR